MSELKSLRRCSHQLPCVRYLNRLDLQPYHSKAAETDLVCPNLCYADQGKCQSFLFHDGECHLYDYKFEEIEGERDTVAIKGTCEEVEASGVTSEFVSRTDRDAILSIFYEPNCLR
jgi:hypothetical protein